MCKQIRIDARIVRQQDVLNWYIEAVCDTGRPSKWVSRVDVA